MITAIEFCDTAGASEPGKFVKVKNGLLRAGGGGPLRSQNFQEQFNSGLWWRHLRIQGTTVDELTDWDSRLEVVARPVSARMATCRISSR
jgi:hypothetical protein